MSSIAQVWPAYTRWRSKAFTWRRELPAARKVVLALGMAALTGLSAQVRVPLVPVPMTGQTFAVLLSGVLLGGTFGALSQAIYVGLGAAGLAWFCGGAGGMAVMRGATAGYLVGFVVAAALVGYVTDRSAAARRFLPQFALMSCGAGVILLFGFLNQVFLLHWSVFSALWHGVLKFVLLDVGKAAAAAAIATALLPKMSDEGRADGAEATGDA